MIEIAMVEDEAEAADLLRSYIDRYSKENEKMFAVTRYDSAIAFLTDYKPKFDLIFMDIELPDLNGMEASRKLREIDRTTALIFVTNMAQFAIKGYEVEALDFVVKPVSYYNFALKMQKAIDRIESNREREIHITLVGGGGENKAVPS